MSKKNIAAVLKESPTREPEKNASELLDDIQYRMSRHAAIATMLEGLTTLVDESQADEVSLIWRGLGDVAWLLQKNIEATREDVGRLYDLLTPEGGAR